MNRTCKTCWWSEGGLCYEGDVKRGTDGRSLKKTDKICDAYASKREMLSKIIPNDKLTIISEFTDTNSNKGKILSCINKGVGVTRYNIWQKTGICFNEIDEIIDELEKHNLLIKEKIGDNCILYFCNF